MAWRKEDEHSMFLCMSTGHTCINIPAAYLIIQQNVYAFITNNISCTQVSSDVFEKELLPAIETDITSGWEKCTPDSLLMLLAAYKHHPVSRT